MHPAASSSSSTSNAASPLHAHSLSHGYSIHNSSQPSSTDEQIVYFEAHAPPPSLPTTTLSSLLSPLCFFMNLFSSTSNLGLLFIILAWYMSATLSNSVNKIILTHFPYATSLTLLETVCVILFSYLGMKAGSVSLPPHISMSKMYSLALPLAIGKDLGQVTTAMAIERLPISFVHTIKSTSPVFTVFLSQVWLGEEHTTEVICSLIPIILGVYLSTVNEVEMNLYGFSCAVLSVVFFTLQNLYSKVLMTMHNVHHTVLVYYTSVIGLVLLLPFWFTVDVGGILLMRFCCTFLPSFLFSQCDSPDLYQPLLLQTNEGFSSIHLWLLYLVAAVGHYVQVIMAIKVLEKASVVTYAVANTFKRIFVIVASIMYFQNPVSTMNAVGILMSVIGIAWYNQARRKIKTSLRKEGREKDAKDALSFSV